MEIKKIEELLTNRYNSLTEREKDAFESLGFWHDERLHEYFNGTRKDIDWKNAYAWSLLGRGFHKAKAKAERIMKTEEKFRYVIKNMKRSRYNFLCEQIDSMYDREELTPVILSFWIQRLRKDKLNLLDSYLHDPIYSVGEIVQFRSNMGADSVLMEVSSSKGKYFYGCGRSQLKRLRNKTFMIIQIDPEIDGKNYANVYSYHEKQGGSRIYKVLPIGSAETYFVVEKFLKKCRTKAVKDARK